MFNIASREDKLKAKAFIEKFFKKLDEITFINNEDFNSETIKGKITRMIDCCRLRTVATDNVHYESDNNSISIYCSENEWQVAISHGQGSSRIEEKYIYCLQADNSLFVEYYRNANHLINFYDVDDADKTHHKYTFDAKGNFICREFNVSNDVTLADGSFYPAHAIKKLQEITTVIPNIAIITKKEVNAPEPYENYCNKEEYAISFDLEGCNYCSESCQTLAHLNTFQPLDKDLYNKYITGEITGKELIKAFKSIQIAKKRAELEASKAVAEKNKIAKAEAAIQNQRDRELISIYRDNKEIMIEIFDALIRNGLLSEEKGFTLNKKPTK